MQGVRAGKNSQTASGCARCNRNRRWSRTSENGGSPGQVHCGSRICFSTGRWWEAEDVADVCYGAEGCCER